MQVSVKLSRGDGVLFELFHLSLTDRLDLLVRKLPSGAPFDRESWLRELFSTRINFAHRKEAYYYIPVKPPKDIKKPLIFGKIGRQITSDENASPDEDLEDVIRDAWKASSIVIDPRKHSDGQKLAMQSRQGVGAPFPLLRSLMTHLGTTPSDTPYYLDVRPITDAATFWDFVEQNEGEITSITLEFLAPNMFGIGDDYDKEWDALKANEKALRAITRIENEHGLNPKTSRIRTAVEYASKGGGGVSAHTKRGKRYSSKNKVKKISIAPVQSGVRRPVIEMVSDAVRLIFGI